MRVEFMIIGAQKCGTTSMAAQLAAHPRICFCREKEPGYFHKTEDWREGLEQYHSLYNPLPGQICGEASTYYTFFPEFRNTPQRLFDYNPDLKLIYVMRQPVERIISHYAHNFVREIDTRPPDEAVFQSPEYLNRSRYAVQIRPYLQLFGPDNVKLVLFEEYTDDQVETLRRLSTFLDIDPTPFESVDTTPQHQTVGQPYIKYEALRNFTGTEAFQKLRNVVPAAIRQPIRHRLLSNKISEKPAFSDETKEALWRLLEDDVRAIEEMLGYRLDAWRQPYSSEL